MSRQSQRVVGGIHNTGSRGLPRQPDSGKASTRLRACFEDNYESPHNANNGIQLNNHLVNRQHETPMKEKTKADRDQKNSPCKKHPLDPREYPQARDSRGSAGRAEIRAQNPRVAAPRQSNRPVERSNQNQTHGR